MKTQPILSFFVFLVIIVSSAFADIDDLRSKQDHDLKLLEQKYNEKARRKWGRPDGTVDSNNPEYKKMEERYRQQAEAVREKYRQMDGRKKELNRIKKEFAGQIDVSGSAPKDVRSDVDLTAKSNKAADDLARQWRDAGHDVVYDKKTGKYHDRTTDTTLWKPSNKSRKKARAKDSDAFDTMGGKKASGVTGKEAMGDAWGNQVDNQKKFDHAREQGDLKTQGKSVSKAAQNVGHESEVTRQADDLRNYRSTDEAGVTKLGESDAVKKKKVEQWQQKAEGELNTTHEKAVKKSKLQKDVRKKLADQADRTSKNTLDPQNKGTGDEIRKRSKKLEQSNENVKRKKAQQAQPEISSSKPNDTPPPDGPDGSSGSDDSSSKRTDDASELPEKTRKSDNLPEKTSKNAENMKKTPKNDDFSPKTTEVDVPDAPETTKQAETDLPDSKRTTKTDTEIPGVRKKSVPDMDTPSKTRQPDMDVPGGGGTGKKAMGVADGVGDVIDAIDKGTTYVEGAMEGDPSKMSSPIVGNDTAERTRGTSAKKWAKEEDKAQEARGDEVRQELKAKLRRKGATSTEAEGAMQKRDAGDHKGFREDVQKIKEKGIEDTEKRGLTPDGKLQEEDGLGERLTEGAKQAGRYVDAAYGGIIQRTEDSVEQRDGHDEDNDGLVDGTQQDVESQQIRKLMRKGISRDDAEKAVRRKNEGDRSMYDNLRDSVQDKEDDGQKGHGLDADGRTSSYETDDYIKDVKDNIKTGAESAGNVILKPADMYHKYHEKKQLDQSKKATDEQAEDVKNRLIESGVDVDEAEKAGKDFSDGKFGSSRDLLSKKEAEIAKKLQDVHGASEDDAKAAAKDWMQGNKKTARDLRDRMAEEREAKAETEPDPTEEDVADEDEEDQAEDIVDNLFDDLEDIMEDEEEEEDDWDDMWADDEEEENDLADSNPLRRNEGHADTDDEDFDWEGNTGNDLLDDMIGGMEKDKYEFTKNQMDFNQAQQDIQTASVTGQGQIDAANQQVDAANEDASASQGETIAQINDTDRGESWGSAIGDGVVEGVTSGAASIGAAIASGINASTYGDKDNDSSSGESGGSTSEGETGTEGEQVAAAPSGGGGGEQRSASSGGSGGVPAEPQAPPSSGGQQQASAPAAAPSGPIYCPKCGGTRFGPYQKVYGPNGQSANDRQCLTCGNMGGRYGTPPASLGNKNTNRPRPTPTPSKSRASSGSTCPFCGKNTFRLSGRDGSLNVYRCSSCGGSTARNSGGGGGWARPPKK